jgi:hypothetical protein
MGQRAGNRSLGRRGAGVLTGTFAAVLLSSMPLDAQMPPDGKKAPAPPKDPPTAKETPKSPGMIRLADGTYLWTGPTAPPGDPGERVLVTQAELQKLADQAEQLKKQLAARRPTPPSGCALAGKVERRGDTSVAVFKATYSFRTTAPNAAVALGGRRGFLVAAALDGNKLPILDTGEDGFAAMIESPGDHKLTLDLETPVGTRGTKNEVGFELGLPRAPITTLALTLPGADVKRVNLATRTPDPAQPARPAETRRLPPIDVKQLAPRPEGGGYPLGPVDLLEVAWEPPPTAAPTSEQVRSAAFEILCDVRDTYIETTARVRFHGPGADWRLSVPGSAMVTVEAVDPAKTVGRPASAAREPDPNRPVWKIDVPDGSTADWVVVATVRQLRPKMSDTKHKGPFPVGPFAVLGVARQTGTVRVVGPANAHTLFRFAHGPDLRREPPPADTAGTTASFQWTTGPVGSAPPAGPLLIIVEATQQTAKVLVRPIYRLSLNELGWRVRADIQVTPIRTELTAVTVEVPAEWQSLEASPPDTVEGVQVGKTEGGRQTVVIRLAAVKKQSFPLTLEASVPVSPTARSAAVPLLRFPRSAERDAEITVAVPDGQEVRGSAREWDGEQPAGWGQPLAAPSGADGRPPRGPTAISGRFDHGLARADLSWHAHQPEITAEVRAELHVQDRTVRVSETLTLKSADGFGRPVRIRVPGGVSPPPGLEPHGPGEWQLPALTDTKADVKEQTLRFVYSVARPARVPEDRGPWKVPVGLCWPVGTTRTDATVRVVSHLDRNLAVGTDPAVWRELPPESAADPDALPAVTLAGSGADLPLILEVKPVPGADAVRVERALVQSWAREDGVTEYLARFRLAGWLAGSIDVRLPGPLAGTNPDFRVDAERPPGLTQVPDPDDAGRKVYRVPLPPDRRAAVLEVRYSVASSRQPGGESVFVPPQLLGAGYARTVRWQVNLPGGSLPLVVGAAVESRWRWRFGMFAPAAGRTDGYLERWFQVGSRADDEPGADEPGDATAVIVGQASPEPLRVYRVSAVWFMVLCSVGVLLLGLIVTRLPAVAVGPVVLVLLAAAACAVVLVPHPAAQAAGAGQFGLAALVATLAVQAGVRWVYRRRVTHLPGFTRTRPEPATAAAGASSARGRPSINGSTGSVSPATPATPTGS